MRILITGDHDISSRALEILRRAAAEINPDVELLFQPGQSVVAVEHRVPLMGPPTIVEPAPPYVRKKQKFPRAPKFLNKGKRR